MSTTIEILDAAMQATNTKSKYALAKALGLHSGLVSDYYNGKRSPDEYACLQIAKAIGRSYEEISTIVRIEAEKDEKRRDVWREHLKRLGGYAAAIMLWVCAGLMCVTLIVTFPKNAEANQSVKKADRSIIQIMRFSGAIKTAAAFVKHVLEALLRRPGFAC